MVGHFHDFCATIAPAYSAGRSPLGIKGSYLGEIHDTINLKTIVYTQKTCRGRKNFQTKHYKTKHNKIKQNPSKTTVDFVLSWPSIAGIRPGL